MADSEEGAVRCVASGESTSIAPGAWTCSSGVAYYVARDADETPLAFARVALFGQFAVLLTMLSRLDRHPSASWARYQLHTFLALDLGRTGVRHLLVGPALRESPGNQYFQQPLGLPSPHPAR